MRVRFSARTHVGMRREVNQDAYASKQLGSINLLVVCDGMGGHAAGEVASELGVETIISAFRPEVEPEDMLREAFIGANRAIYEAGRGSMGTTGVAALFTPGGLYVANVGDSRAYLVREGQITQISHDHSFVSDQVAAGLMTPAQARSSNIRNIITRALGHSSEVEVDLFALALRPGDTVILSTDGMHGLITDEEIAEIAGMLPPDAAVERLVDLANERGGVDNITVMVAQVDTLTGDDDEPRTHTADAPSVVTAPRSAPVERPLNPLGGLLALALLLLLVSTVSYVWLSLPAGELPAAQPSRVPPAATLFPLPPSMPTATPLPTPASSPTPDL
ncbi:PP2C family protein-serine/threonine phosphatase [Candidatus Chloroploca asiatica]|uniref:Protein phosphatase n=1 Tax=Candidatus Chloroploca asiatica TaxID=1506545 RepID=A0A2H3L275_9CHLR|nr:PP2C family serine/threonine-protein phosphatase [Candidatus Chloroploca asiatica]PDV97247.1 protein phosphatase [Candidatus Chloroploca asiatica]